MVDFVDEHGRFGISEEDAKEFVGILSQVLGEISAEVFVFGSRAKGGFRDNSDLDVAVKGEGLGGKVSELRRAFEESRMRNRVDLVYLDESVEWFRGEVAEGATRISF